MIEVLEALGTKECTSQPANNYSWKYTRFRAPEHCVQYFTGLTGTINSYGLNLNNPAMSTLLQAQNYKNCIRKEKGEGVTPPAVWDGKSAKCVERIIRQMVVAKNPPNVWRAKNRPKGCFRNEVSRMLAIPRVSFLKTWQGVNYQHPILL